MPWIGMYIAAASAVCSVAMAVDAFNAFRSKIFWFPCKYFSLNAFSLTVLAVAMKLPIDLTSKAFGSTDLHARISSLTLMSTAMSNFMTWLGSMENNEVVLNIAALGILVITVAVNVCIHDVQIGLLPQNTLVEEVGCIFLMLFMLVTLCSLAIMLPSAKRYIDLKYNEMHKSVLNRQDEWGKYTTDELRIVVKRYWIMAATSNPQFLVARSVISATSGFICPLIALIIIESYIRGFVPVETGPPNCIPVTLIYRVVTSNYGSSLILILYIQTIGVALGSIAPLFRWSLATRFKSSEIGRKSFRDEFKIESYWTSMLLEWRQQIRHHKCLNHAKKLLLNFCIKLQIWFVLTNKLLVFISALCGRGLLVCFRSIKNVKRAHSINDVSGLESRDAEEDFSQYVLLLEGEGQLPQYILNYICAEMDRLIKEGEKKQPKNLIGLLHKSMNFDGVREFDSKEVPSIYSQEPPNCWSLSVVTLTGIAVALPNTTKANQLLCSINEGLSLVKHVEQVLDTNAKLESIRNAAYKVWEELRQYRKWQDMYIQSSSLKGKSYKETLQNLSNVAEKKVKDFTAEIKDFVMQNPLNWPIEVIAAHSMYRITQTIMLAHKDDQRQTDEELFERISIMISDILAACLTNLAHAITLKCQRNSIKERQDNVREAVVLLGESQEILEFLQQRRLPRMDPSKAANIDEWKAFLQQANENLTAAKNRVSIPTRSMSLK
ncbi:hypothetical protein C2S53_001907 [Perilla frutescens var. hirtella]|uniref:Uncharacterized protein n=1 Tax=Perilla frutescens var. hirtella TaxID=608512 RepID=A0AAD4P2P4_PERFH|nr:hypothetical protein C2S53_001907 [Perilla frutescens var. hirtella]